MLLWCHARLTSCYLLRPSFWCEIDNGSIISARAYQKVDKAPQCPHTLHAHDTLHAHECPAHASIAAAYFRHGQLASTLDKSSFASMFMIFWCRVFEIRLAAVMLAYFRYHVIRAHRRVAFPSLIFSPPIYALADNFSAQMPISTETARRRRFMKYHSFFTSMRYFIRRWAGIFDYHHDDKLPAD